MKDEYEEIDLLAMLSQRFAAGEGVVTLPVNMTDTQILALIKNACIWSQGKAFQVVPPKSHTKPFTCPYCGSPTPDGDELVLDAWGYFHCVENECNARLQLDESGRAVGYINRPIES